MRGHAVGRGLKVLLRGRGHEASVGDPGPRVLQEGLGLEAIQEGRDLEAIQEGRDLEAPLEGPEALIEGRGQEDHPIAGPHQEALATVVILSGKKVFLFSCTLFLWYNNKVIIC